MRSVGFLLLILIFSFIDGSNLSRKKPPKTSGKGALLSTNFQSMEALKKVIRIEYFKGKKSQVRLIHSSNGNAVVGVLKTGISEKDFQIARNGSFWDKFLLGLKTPYSVLKKNDFLRVYLLSRRTDSVFGEGDIAFYDLALTMVQHIDDEDLVNIPEKDLSEKGYINTFNHITAQTFTTTVFSEKLADFIADVHERYNMPELITGEFTAEQLSNIQKGPIDNYVDMINNEWGQELGKKLQAKHQITRQTVWTPELLANYLNDIQNYYSWVLQIGFQPFKPEDEVVQRFTKKINRIMEDVSGF